MALLVVSIAMDSACPFLSCVSLYIAQAHISHQNAMNPRTCSEFSVLSELAPGWYVSITSVECLHFRFTQAPSCGSRTSNVIANCEVLIGALELIGNSLLYPCRYWYIARARVLHNTYADYKNHLIYPLAALN